MMVSSFIWCSQLVARQECWVSEETGEEPTTISQATMRKGSVAPQATVTTAKTFDFPVDWNGDRVTKVNPNGYRLKIDGDVSSPVELTLEELYSMPNVQRTLKIRCENGWTADVPWEGITLSYLLSQAGASLKSIANARVESITGYSRTVSSDEIADPDNIIALKAGGAPLTVEHGYPARLVLPARFGFDWVKYVARITCANKQHD